MGLAALDRTVSELVEQGLSPATATVYRSGWKRYLHFCGRFSLTPLPASEYHLCAFAAHLSDAVSWQTIRSYLCAVRFYHIRNNLPDPSNVSMPKLAYVLKGVHKRTPEYQRPTRHPVTADVLRRIHYLWSKTPITFNTTMLWAAFCLGFFGFLRPGEFTFAPNFPHSGLTVSDVAINSRDNPRVLIVLIRTSKTDQFGKGTHLYLGRTESSLCPVLSMLAYLALRPPTPGPLFIFRHGTPLSRGQLSAHLRAALCNVGLQSSRFSSHSFRIGAASTAASAGFKRFIHPKTW